MKDEQVQDPGDAARHSCHLAEQALQKDAGNYRALLESAPVAILATDRQGRIVLFNRQAEEMFGYTRDEVFGQTVETLIPPRLQNAHVQHRADYMQAPRSRPMGIGMDLIGRRHDGSEFPVEVGLSTVQTENGTLVMAFIADISTRKQMQAALRQSEEKYRTLVEQSLQGVMIVRGLRPRIVFANPALSEMTGYSVEQLTHMPPDKVEALIHPEHPEVLQRFRDRLQGKSVPSRYGFRVIRKDGTAVWLQMSSNLIEYQGEPAVQATLVDITERRRTEAALRQRTVELQTHNEELDAFAHTVAHDLKNPLALTIGFADALMTRYADLSDQELEKYLETIARNGRRMRRIIDELLLLSSVRRLQEVEITPLDMGAIVSQAREREAQLIEERQPTIIVPESWPTALGHGPWIEEVWANYLSNALKYGGHPPHVELGATVQDDGQVRFWVKDNGPGLTPEEQDQLFKPFTRLAQVRVQGHGLGLSIVRRIVNKLSGKVGVESAGVPGQGSTFYFTLPAAEKNSRGNPENTE